MTRKDYILIAQIIRELPSENCEEADGQTRTAEAFAATLARHNSAFNREKFMVAALGKNHPLNARAHAKS